jgi:hypothetical protein
MPAYRNALYDSIHSSLVAASNPEMDAARLKYMTPALLLASPTSSAHAAGCQISLVLAGESCFVRDSVAAIVSAMPAYRNALYDSIHSSLVAASNPEMGSTTETSRYEESQRELTNPA